jgi:hypothetical protein
MKASSVSRVENISFLLESQQIPGSDDCKVGQDNGKLPLFCSPESELDSSMQRRNVEKMV